MSNNSNVVFVDTSKEVIDTMKKLVKSGLRKSGRLITKTMKEKNKSKWTKNIENHFSSWARTDRKTKQESLQVGYLKPSRVKKRKKKPSFASPAWVEHGTRAHLIKSKTKLKKFGITLPILQPMGIAGKYGTKANHRGARASNLLRNSFLDNQEQIGKNQEELLSKLSLEIKKAKGYIHISEGPDYVN